MGEGIREHMSPPSLPPPPRVPHIQLNGEKGRGEGWGGEELESESESESDRKLLGAVHPLQVLDRPKRASESGRIKSA